jgi:cytochrome d ubiquinol oxidase subunit II
MELLAFFIIALALFVWGTLFLIECGVAMLAPWAENFGGRETFSRYLQPVWEATNVFLVFALVALIAFFPEAIAAWASALAVPFFFFLAAMGIRALGMLLTFYQGGASRSGTWLLALGGLLSPVIVVTSIFPYFFFGTGIWTGDGWPLACALTGMAISLALFFAATLFYGISKKRSASSEASCLSVIRISFCVFALAAAAFEIFGSGVVLRMPFIGAWYLISLTAILIAELGAIMLLTRRDLPRAMPFGFGVLTFAILAVGACLAQMPFLIYGRTNIYDVFTAPDIAQMLMIVFAIGAVITLASLAMLLAVQMRKKTVG